MGYTIKIDGKYFKDFIYATKEDQGRFLGHGAQGSLIHEGDILDLELTEKAEAKFTKRSVGNKISLILQVEEYRKKEIHIVPLA